MMIEFYFVLSPYQHAKNIMRLKTKNLKNIEALQESRYSYKKSVYYLCFGHILCIIKIAGEFRKILETREKRPAKFDVRRVKLRTLNYQL